MANARQFMAARTGAWAKSGGWVNPYVTDGLVAMWDGEWNAGPGVHDNNISTWKDLIGLTDISLFEATINSDNVQLYRDGNSYGSADFSKFIGYGCIEIVINKERASSYSNDSDNSIITIGSIYQGYGICDQSGGKVSDNNDPVSSDYVRIRYGAPQSLSFNKSGAITTSIYRNGILSNDGTISAGLRYNNGENSLNWNKQVQYQSEYARCSDIKYHCIRLYSRNLTAAEIAANNSVDATRFKILY